eukprot:sb/3470142/
MANRVVEIVRVPGLLRYSDGLLLQKDLWQKAKETRSNFLILCEHHPVFTFGKRQRKLDKREVEGADCHQTDRGGLTTFHGPGQLVAYPILHLNNFKPSAVWYVRTLEEVVMATCHDLGVDVARDTEHVGIWAGRDKICAVGVNIRSRCTTHGIALNCNTDLSWFNNITPCGIEDRGVTSLSQKLGRECGVGETVECFVEQFKLGFECTTAL